MWPETVSDFAVGVLYYGDLCVLRWLLLSFLVDSYVMGFTNDLCVVKKNWCSVQLVSWAELFSLIQFAMVLYDPEGE